MIKCDTHQIGKTVEVVDPREWVGSGRQRDCSNHFGKQLAGSHEVESSGNSYDLVIPFLRHRCCKNLPRCSKGHKNVL